MSVRREIEIEATPDEVWEALATEEGREAWLDEPDREIRIESADAPHRLVWWWWEGDSPATRVEFLVVAGFLRHARGGDRELAFGAARLAVGPVRDGGRLSDELGAVFAALADPTRRWMVEALLRDGSSTVPALTAELPITRQAVAKHLSALDQAGLVERAPAAGREVRYQLREAALDPAAAWLVDAQTAWDERLMRLKRAVSGQDQA